MPIIPTVIGNDPDFELPDINEINLYSYPTHLNTKPYKIKQLKQPIKYRQQPTNNPFEIKIPQCQSKCDLPPYKCDLPPYNPYETQQPHSPYRNNKPKITYNPYETQQTQDSYKNYKQQPSNNPNENQQPHSPYRNNKPKITYNPFENLDLLSAYRNNTPKPTYPSPSQNQQPQNKNNTNNKPNWITYAQQLFKENDFDNNGILDIEEFPILVKKIFKKFNLNTPSTAECYFLMEAFDANKDGEIDQFEY